VRVAACSTYFACDPRLCCDAAAAAPRRALAPPRCVVLLRVASRRDRGRGVGCCGTPMSCAGSPQRAGAAAWEREDDDASSRRRGGAYASHAATHCTRKRLRGAAPSGDSGGDGGSGCAAVGVLRGSPRFSAPPAAARDEAMKDAGKAELYLAHVRDTYGEDVLRVLQPRASVCVFVCDAVWAPASLPLRRLLHRRLPRVCDDADGDERAVRRR
jgi:hypothetical protein